MDLFESSVPNEFSIFRYKTIKDKKSFKLKYPINNDDTVKDLFKNIYLSLNDKNTLNENYIFAFIQKNKINDKKIKAIEESIVPNKILRDLIKKKFGRFDNIKQTFEIKKFIKENKEIIDKEIKTGDKGGIWLNTIKYNFKKEIKKYNEDNLSSEQLFKSCSSVGHDYDDIDLNILTDKKLDSSIINKDNSIKLIFPNNYLDKLLLDYDIESLNFITLNDYMKFLKSTIDVDDKIIFKGILRKYYPNIKDYNVDEKDYIKSKKCDEFQLNIRNTQINKLD